MGFHLNLGKVFWLVTAVLLVGMISSQPAIAVWHILLNEDFNNDPPEWPWGNWELDPDLTWSGVG